MAKKYIHKKDTKIPIYVGRLILLVSNSAKLVRKEIPRFGKGKRVYAHAMTDRYKNTTGFYIVLNFDNKYTKVTHGTISHEALHIVNFLLDYVGVAHDVDNDEASTYLMGWVVDQLYKWIDELGLKVELDG